MPQYLHHHLKMHHLHFTEVNELYISLSLQAFALGLTGIFVPIYIYTLGFSVTALATFFIVAFFAGILTYPAAAKLTSSIGPKHVIALSYIFLFCYVLTLFLLPTNNQLLYVSAIIGGVGAGMFWIARHIDFATIINSKNTVKKLSTLLIFYIIAQASSPFIGGVIATNFGIGYGLLASSVGLLTAIYPLLRTPEPIVPRKTRIRPMRTAPARHLIANFAMQSQTTVGLYTWPLFIFLIVGSYQNVGLIATISLMLSVFMLHKVGHFGSQKKSEKVFRIGLISRTFVHIIRRFSSSFPQTLSVNILGDLTDVLVSVPFTARFYNGARKYDIPAYLTDMEIAGGLGKISVWLVLMTVSIQFGLKAGLMATFIQAAIMMPVLHLIEPLKK
jgi:MFS family permease